MPGSCTIQAEKSFSPNITSQDYLYCLLFFCDGSLFFSFEMESQVAQANVELLL